MPSTMNTRRRIEQGVKKLGEEARTTAARARSLATDAFVIGVGAPAYAIEKLGEAARDAMGRPGRKMARVRKVAKQAKRAVKASDARSFEERSHGELYQLAQVRDIEGRSGMSKKQLIAALRR